MMEIQILVENTSSDIACGEHGLSFFITYKGKNYLLDAGTTGLFTENATAMHIDLSSVEAAFLSHAHYDHAGGFRDFFKLNQKAKVWLQAAAGNKYYYKIAGPLKKYIGIPKGLLEDFPERFSFADGFRDLGNGIFLLPHSSEGIRERAVRTHMCAVIGGKTFYDDFSHEQTLIFEEEDGLVCFNSCSHAGVDIIISEVRKAFPGKRIKAFLGGFHMMGLTGTDSCSYRKEEVQTLARKLLPEDLTFYSGHCTGTVAFEWLREVLGEHLQAMYSGMKIALLTP